MGRIKTIIQDIYNNICFLTSLLILLAFVLWAGIAMGGWAVIGKHNLQLIQDPTDPIMSIYFAMIMIGLALSQFILFFIYWNKNQQPKKEITQNATG